MAVVVVVLGTAPGAQAQDDPGPPPVPDPRVSPTLVAVPVDSPAYRDAVARYRDAENRLNGARATYTESEATLGVLSSADARLAGQANEATRKRRKADGRAAQLRTGVQQFAVASYMAGGIGQPVSPDLDLDQINERARQTRPRRHGQRAAVRRARRQRRPSAAHGRGARAGRRRSGRRGSPHRRDRGDRDGALSDGSRAAADLVRFAGAGLRRTTRGASGRARLQLSWSSTRT